MNKSSKKNVKKVAKQQPKKSNNMKLVSIFVALLIVVLVAALGLVLQNNREISHRLRLYESCSKLNGSFLKEDTKLQTCVSYNDVKSIKKSVKTFQDCADEYAKRYGHGLIEAAGGSDNPYAFLGGCWMPDGRSFYENRVEKKS